MPLSVVEQLKQTLRDHADNIAINGDDGLLTYRELDEGAEQVRAHLEEAGVRPGDRVFYVGERGLYFGVAVLATLRARAVWFPLETEATVERQQALVGEAGGSPALVVTAEAERRAIELGLRPLRVDQMDAQLQVRQVAAPNPLEPAYIMLTSGTTGTPKRVVTCHSGLARLASRLAARLQITSDDRVLQLHPASVDISLEELSIAWRTGARTITIPDSLRTDLVGFDAHLRRHGVTVVDVPTSLWLIWIEAIERGDVPPPPSHLRVVGVGSEPVPNDAIKRWVAACSAGPNLFSLYGSTETGITTHVDGPLLTGFDNGAGTLLGRPMAGVVSYILDEHYDPVEKGEQGQLFVRGDVAALGYDDAPLATSRAFVPDPFSEAPGGRMYATGDLVSEDPSGTLVHHGRVDSVLLINGFSVRPEGVQEVISAVPGVVSSNVHASRSGGVSTLIADLALDAPERSSAWKEVYHALYAADDSEYPLGLNAASWLSAVDGEPMPIATMAAWRDAIVTKIRTLAPRRVLELGCGTGMVLHGLLGRVERYVGVDFVPEVLDTLSAEVQRSGTSTSVNLIEADLHDALQSITETFDVVVLNSVTQYFSGDADLTKVLEMAVAVLTPGGHLVVGDVRNLDLESEYRRWLAGHTTHSARGARTSDEIELLLSPRWFHDLDSLGSRTVTAHTTSKYVDELNEMSLFRFDAVLRLDTPDVEETTHRELDGKDPDISMILEAVGKNGPIVTRAVSRVNGLAKWRAALLAEGVSSEAVPHPTSAEHVDMVYFHETDRPVAEAVLAAVVRNRAVPLTANRPQSSGEVEVVRRVVEHVRSTLAPHERPSIYRVEHGGVLTTVPVTTGSSSVSQEPTSAESAIADVWFDVLGQRPASDDNFFDLGGNSLNLARVLVRLRSLYGSDVSSEQFFAAPTVRGMADLLGASTVRDTAQLRTDSAAPARLPQLVASLGWTGPASFAQERLWLLDQLRPHSYAYHSPFVFDIVGDLDIEALERAAASLVEAHPVLATALTLCDGVLVQTLTGRTPSVTVLQDDTIADPGAFSTQELGFVKAPFDLKSGDVFRLAVRRLSDGRRRLVFVLHHVAVDELSLPIIFGDFARSYTAATAGNDPRLDPPPLKYLDVATYERSVPAARKRAESRAFWREHLEGAPQRTNLPVDRPRPQTLGSSGRREPVSLSADLFARADAAARREGISSFQWWFGMFSLFISRESGAQDVVVGAPSANRLYAGTEDIVGFFVNTLPVRSQLDSNPTVSDHLAATARHLLAAQRHEAVPLQEILTDLGVARDSTANPLFQTMVILEPPEPLQMDLGGATAMAHDITEITSTMDLTLIVRPSSTDPQLHLVHDLDVLTPQEARRMASTFGALLTAVLADPDRRCHDAVPLPSELESVVVGEQVAVPELSLCEAFLAAADQHPNRAAIIEQGRTTTYEELSDRVVLLAEQLRSNGALPPFIPVLLPASVDLVVAMLAINTVGSAFVPLSVEWPEARLAQAMATIASPVVVGRAGSPVPDSVAAEVVVVPTQAPHVHRSALAAVDLEAPMYAIFTSGSTGEPKAAVVPHRGVVNRVAWMNTELGVSAARRVLQSTAPQYDSMVWELLWPLTVGGASIIGGADLQARPDALCDLVSDQQVTTIDLVPGALKSVLEHVTHHAGRREALASVQVAVVGGEELGERVAALVGRAGLRARLLNLYGPTEASIGSIVHEVDPAQTGRVPIGRPIANSSAAILDDQFQPVPRGVHGELVLGGACVGVGYHGDARRTRAKFVDLPGLGRSYRTGDRARIRSDGTLEFLGRDDDQLSINGVRVESGEVVRALESLDGVASGGVTSVVVPSDLLRRLVEQLRTVEANHGRTAELAAILDEVEQNR